MAGMIGTGQAYGNKALSGFIRESAQQNQMELAAKQLNEQKKARSANMTVQGGVVGYMSGPTIAEMMAPEAAVTSPTSLSIGAGAETLPVAGAVDAGGLEGASVLSGAGTPSAMGATVTPSLGTTALTTGAETAATTAATEIGTTAATEAATGAAGAEIGAETGAGLGPLGIVAGAGLGYLLSKLF